MVVVVVIAVEKDLCGEVMNAVHGDFTSSVSLTDSIAEATGPDNLETAHLEPVSSERGTAIEHPTKHSGPEPNVALHA